MHLLRRALVRRFDHRHPVARAASAFIEGLENRRLFAFGLTTTATTFTVDTGGGVTFSVLRQGTSSTIHSGDLTSFKRNGVEFEAPYSATSRYSHFESGLSNGSVISAALDPAGNWIKITCDDTTATVGSGGTGVIHYYMAKKNDPNIYMATYAPVMLVSSTRFITYLDWNKFPNHPDASDTSGSTGAIESTDVFADASGQTHSKYYGETRNIEHVYHSATGPSAGAYMYVGNRESGSGGPFWKDIDYQSTGASVELYNMPFSDHSQTEAFRPGLHGPFALSLTGGAAPTVTPNYDFIDGLGLAGWVSPADRGSLTGKISGIAAGRVPTVALSNTTAQYWTTPDASGNYTIPNIKPGTYTETLYDEELAVGTRTVTITAGQTTAANIANTYYLPPAVFRVGTWDGTPREFLNGDKITYMHPQDPRMAPWVDTTFTVGTSVTNTWPLSQWKDPSLDDVNRLTFTLTAAQAATASTLRIGITRAQAGGRPIISVNGSSYSAAPSPSSQPGTRGITLGNWRGNNTTFTYNISTSSLHAGVNTIDIGIASGSSSTSRYLQPQFTYDAIDLVATSSLTNAPRLTSIALTPAGSTVSTNGSKTFTATARDQFNNVIAANVDFSATRGVIDDTGLYIAPATTGSDTIRAVVGTVTGTTTISVVSDTPTVATAASASPNPVTGTTTTLAVLGADSAGESGLTYSWSALGTPPAPVGFSANATNAAKSTTASFAKAGTYNFRVTIVNDRGFSATSDVSVNVTATLAGISVNPASASVGAGETTTFTATGVDQFGQAMTLPSAVTWAVLSGGGTIDSSGVYTAAASAGSAVVQATSGSRSGTAAVTIVDEIAPQVLGSAFDYQTAQAVTLTFSEDVLASLDADDLAIVNIATGIRVPASEFTLKTSGPAGSPTTATWTHNASAGSLPDGNYRATLASSSVADASGNALAADATLDFFVLAGDLNHDRTVNFSDLVILAQNYNQSGKTFGQGNANYSADGKVDFGDLVLLAQRYNAILQPATTTMATTQKKDSIASTIV